MRRIFLSGVIGMVVLLGVWSPAALAAEAKEKPVVEHILELLLQRGQITQNEMKRV